MKSITWGKQLGHSTSKTRDIAVALAGPFISPKSETLTLFFEQKYCSGGVSHFKKRWKTFSAPNTSYSKKYLSKFFIKMTIHLNTTELLSEFSCFFIALPQKHYQKNGIVTEII